MNKKSKMFWRMIFASLIRRRSRMIVAVLAIIVGAAILSGLEMIYYDVPRQMSAEFRSYGANIILAPDGGEYISDDQLKEATDHFPASELEGYTGYRYVNTKVNNNPVTLAAIDFESILKTSPYWHIDGEMPSGDGETLVGSKVAEEFGLKEGSILSCVNSVEITDDIDTSYIEDYEITEDPTTGEKFADHMLELKVTGILDTGGSEEEYAYVTYADAENISLTKRGYDVVEVSVAQMQDKLKSYTEDITEDVDGVSAKLVKRVTASETSVLGKLESLVFIVTAVVLVLTMICVATTMTAVIAERRKEIGLRKAIGATNRSIVTQFMTEGLMLGGVGGILGSLLGYAFAQYISMNVFGSAITFRPLLIPITIIASVLVTGIACISPIKSAVDVDPALVLKGE